VIAEERNRRKVKGVIHCHTNLSYDCSVELAVLCTKLQSEGFSFVALTDHVKGISDEQYRSFADACRTFSTNSFVVIPGLEVRLADDSEIAAIGVNCFINSNNKQDVVDFIHKQGGYSIWVHPHKRGRPSLKLSNCDAIEIMNGKEDGTVAPNLLLFVQAVILRFSGKKFHFIFGADLHDLSESVQIWTECEVDSFSEVEIVRALNEGRFTNQVARIRVPSNGKISIVVFIVMICLRLAYQIWNVVLSLIPHKMRKNAIYLSRWFKFYLKGNL
jgi:hypothetical protein